MTRLLSLLIFASLAVPSFSQSRCEPPPPLVIDVDYIIEGFAPTDDQPLWRKAAVDGQPLWAEAGVSLYARGKLVRSVAADWQGRFTLDHLPLGDYRLSIQGVGNFGVKVVPTDPFKQRRYYGFGLYNGCPTWGFTTN